MRSARSWKAHLDQNFCTFSAFKRVTTKTRLGHQVSNMAVRKMHKIFTFLSIDLCNIWSPQSWKGVDAQSQRLVCSWNASGLARFVWLVPMHTVDNTWPFFAEIVSNFDRNCFSRIIFVEISCLWLQCPIRSDPDLGFTDGGTRTIALKISYNVNILLHDGWGTR